MTKATKAKRFEAYKVTNLINGKLYFGITTMKIKRRWGQHISCASPLAKCILHRAIAKHGPGNFTIELAGTADSWEALAELERTLISANNSLSPNGYNMTSGGDGSLNPCDETRSKMSKKARARWSTPEAKALNAERTRKRLATPEARKANGILISAGWTEESKASMSKRSQAMWESPETRAAIAEKRAAGWTPEVRKAHGVKQRARWADPEQRAALLAKRSTPELLAARGAAISAGIARAKAAKLALMEATK